MTIKTNSLSRYRKRMNIPLYDLAHLLNIDISNLSKVERGIRDPNPRMILLYHILFNVPLLDLFTDQYEELKVLLQRRSKKLISQLEIEKPSKSRNRISYINDFVKKLTTETYGR